MIDDPAFYQGLPSDPELRRVAEEALEALLAHYPFWATDLGFHQWDHRLPDYEDASRQAFQDVIQRSREALAEIDPATLSKEDLADYRMLTNQLALVWRDETLDRQETRDPNLYNYIVSASLLSLARRQFGTPENRAVNAASRLEQVPGLLDYAKKTVDNPPKIFVEMAIPQFKATIPFFDLITEAFSGASSDAQRRVQRSVEKAKEAYEDFGRFLEDNLLSRAHGEYRLGAQRYQERLALQEGIDTPLDQLLQQGYDELARLHEAFDQAGHQIDPGRDPQEILDEVRRDHPRAEELIAYTSSVLGELRDFCTERRLLSIPDNAPDPDVVETPPFMRMTTYASIDPPGPFEKEAAQSYFQVTLPDPSWSEHDQDEHLKGYNSFAARIISVHEVYPGHYLQFLHLPRCVSTVRRILSSGAFVEGWAHYTEELMVEQGYYRGDPKMRLVQVAEALERVGRYIVGIRLHAEDMTFDQAQEFFVKECYLAPVHARRETLRGTVDPFYLIYTLGKLEILRLRERAQEEWGKAYSLNRFHNALLSHGYPMFPVVTALMF